MTSAACVVRGRHYGRRVKLREVIRILERDGWRLDRQSGSHRQFRHPERTGTVTVAGNLGEDVPRGTLASIWRQAGRPGGESHD
jgi:predicted RNA binding protein YcfA (HicA-like mRNA interferase family)